MGAAHLKIQKFTNSDSISKLLSQMESVDNVEFILQNKWTNIPLQQAITDRIREVFTENKIRSISNVSATSACILTALVISADAESIAEILSAEETQRAWLNANYSFLVNNFGEENILSFVLYYIKGVPELRVVIVPINKYGRVGLGGFPMVLVKNARSYSRKMRECGLEGLFVEILTVPKGKNGNLIYLDTKVENIIIPEQLTAREEPIDEQLEASVTPLVEEYSRFNKNLFSEESTERELENMDVNFPWGPVKGEIYHNDGYEKENLDLILIRSENDPSSVNKSGHESNEDQIGKYSLIQQIAEQSQKTVLLLKEAGDVSFDILVVKNPEIEKMIQILKAELLENFNKVNELSEKEREAERLLKELLAQFLLPAA